MVEKATMSITELANVLGISRPFAYKLVQVPGFPIIKVGKRKLVPITAFNEWLNSNIRQEGEITNECHCYESSNQRP